jgi:hypothetical protein
VYPAWIPANICYAVEITTYALSVGTTAACTIIIVARILLVSRMPGASKQPHLAVEIITESAALYTISALVYIGMIQRQSNNPYTNIFFSYMAVRLPHISVTIYHHSNIILVYNRTLCQYLSCSVYP